MKPITKPDHELAARLRYARQLAEKGAFTDAVHFAFTDEPLPFEPASEGVIQAAVVRETMRRLDESISKLEGSDPRDRILAKIRADIFTRSQIRQRLRGKNGLDTETFNRAWENLCSTGVIIVSHSQRGLYKLAVGKTDKSLRPSVPTLEET